MIVPLRTQWALDAFTVTFKVEKCLQLLNDYLSKYLCIEALCFLLKASRILNP